MVWLMRSVTEREDALSAVSCLDILLQRGAKLAFFNIISPSQPSYLHDVLFFVVPYDKFESHFE